MTVGRRALWKALALLALLLGACAPAAGQEESLPMTDDHATRQSYLTYWQSLEQAGVTGLERFARTVQRVVDTRAAQEGSQEEAVRAVLDDLVDLFVGARFRLEKTLVMASPPLLGDDALDESDADLEGFAERFRAGEGRFRHFALNAAAAYSTPDSLVELAARLRGGDLSARSDDSVADIATNRIGRAFTRLLRERSLAELADGTTVRDWLREQFGSR